MLRDSQTLEELKTFVRYPNRTWKAARGTNIHDDRVMSLIWALMILEVPITEQYFEIEQFDENQKPAVISRLDFGLRQFSNTLSLYNDEMLTSEWSTMPVYIDSETMTGSVNPVYGRDITDLQDNGWEIL